jgi:hypothetical protein
MGDIQIVKQRYRENFKFEEDKKLKEHVNTIIHFKDLMASKGIVLQDENFRYYRSIGVVAEYPNLIEFCYPNVTFDKEGLLDLKSLHPDLIVKKFFPGYLFGKDSILMANHYFRRGFSEVNTFAPSFIVEYWNFDSSKIKKYIAIDTDRVRINLDEFLLEERDFWYGARFNENIETIPDGPIKLRPPSEFDSLDIKAFYSDTYCLDIIWSTKDGIKSFQAEEIKTEEIKVQENGMEYHPVRYIHAEYDINNQHFRHFDGAMHFYTSEEYYARKDSDLNYNSKNQTHIKTLSRKLFKLNGEIDVERWSIFISHFFAGDPLCYEYFENRYPEYIQEMIAKRRL